jgi:hypothetical protein
VLEHVLEVPALVEQVRERVVERVRRRLGQGALGQGRHLVVGRPSSIDRLPSTWRS